MIHLLSGVQEVLIYYTGNGGQEGDSLTVRSTRVLIYYTGYGGQEGDSLTVRSTRVLIYYTGHGT